MKLSEIAEYLGARLEGDGDVDIQGVAGIEEARSQHLTFVSNPRYTRQILTTKAGAVLLSESVEEASVPVLVSSNPYLDFARAIHLFYRVPETMPGIHPSAVIDESARIGAGPSIGPNVVIGADVELGDHATLYAGVMLYSGARIGSGFIAHAHSCVREHCEVGNHVTLQNGAVVGADGFGFAPRGDGSYEKIVQSGIAVLEDDVELGAYACVDRATVGETRIGAGTKLDNLVQIGHGASVGRDTVLAAQVGVAGSSRVGDRVVLAGQVGVAGHITIEDEVLATAQTGIARSVQKGKKISGTPEMDSTLWRRNYVLMHDLPRIVRRLRDLERKIEEMEE